MAPPLGIKLIWGTCACGHDGRQKLPDICGSCVRDRDRKQDKSHRTRDRSSELARARTVQIKLRFKQLPLDLKLGLLQELKDLV